MIACRTWRRTARPFGIAWCLVLGALAACAGQPDPADAAPAAAGDTTAPSLATFTVDTTTVDVPLELPAQLYVEHDAFVVARANGTVDSLFMDLGDRVNTGELLARLESTDQQLALASANAAYENLERVAVRARTLASSGGMTVADSEQVEFQLREADLARREALRALDLTRVTSPFAGVVTSRLARPRQFVSVGDTLMRVTELAPLYARIRVPEASARMLRVGQRTTVTGAGGATSEAVVVQAAPIIDAASGTREVVLRVQQPRGALIAGASVTVRLGASRRTVVFVPREAIAPEGYALVVENGRSTVRPVTLGAAAGEGRVEVISGLAVGEQLARPGR